MCVEDLDPYLTGVGFIENATTRIWRFVQTLDIQIDGNPLTVNWFGGGESSSNAIKIMEMSIHLQVPPAQSSPSNILNALNDDSLRQIFDNDLLDMDDLCSLAEVCKHFNSIAKDAFPQKYRRKVNEISEQNSLWRYDRFLRHFGSLIRTFKLQRR